ncbi:hypothetical protein CDAR_61351 [Caerostris darwini]|uniref:Uncharacterized protein n=1 Tax=Caerostris darwini TaxID=1538125 RepID=A0AAV4WXG5_9ARAC|nr:hypothetical protein CDAR_61351 [Caerostris darwini]
MTYLYVCHLAWPSTPLKLLPINTSSAFLLTNEVSNQPKTLLIPPSRMRGEDMSKQIEMSSAIFVNSFRKIREVNILILTPKYVMARIGNKVIGANDSREEVRKLVM